MKKKKKKKTHRKNKAVIEIHESEIIGYVVPAYPNTYIFAIFFIL